MNRQMQIRVGLTVVVGILILIVSVSSLSNFAKAQMMRVWHVRFDQAGGLGGGDEVLVNGLRKGAVRGLHLDGDHVVVDLALSNEIELTRDSRVAIRNVGLMGEKVIAVDLRTTGGAWSTRDTIPGEFEKGMSEVMAEVGRTVDSVEGLARQLKALSDAMEKRGGFNETLDNFRKTSEQLRLAVEENRTAFHATLENLASASKTAKSLTVDREAQIKESIDHFASAARNLDALSMRLDSLRTSVQSVANKLDRGQGSLGHLVNDDKLYADLNSSVKSLKALIEDVKANPKKYFKFSVF
jgi:phospholipid/cholesterol/gamma-HCH transport system substrate-binding protein